MCVYVCYAGGEKNYFYCCHTRECEEEERHVINIVSFIGFLFLVAVTAMRKIFIAFSTTKRKECVCVFVWNDLKGESSSSRL